MSRSRTSSEKRGRIVVLTGPSGVGKTTVARRLLADERVQRVITATTRAPRAGETHGRDYLFMNEPEFARRRDCGEFLEWAEVYGRFYATPRAGVQAVVDAGKVALLVIDVQGAEQIKEAGIGARFIFLLPPDSDTLKDRLTDRGTEGKAQRGRRLEEATEEIARSGWFDHRIENDDLEETVKKVREVLDLDDPTP